MHSTSSSSRFRLRAALALCSFASVVACGSTGDPSNQTADCPQAFYVDADGATFAAGPLPDDQCAKLCGKAVFSCAVASVDAGKASIECQPTCQ